MKPAWRRTLLGVALLALVGALASTFWRALQPPPAAAPGAAVPTQGLPWQIEQPGDGRSRVFGLTLGADTLAQARSRFGDAIQVALVARLDETGALEALVDPFQAGFVSGRLVLAFEVSEPTLRRWRDNAAGSTPMADGVRRFTLRAADAAEAASAPLSAISFVPLIRLSEADIRQRFGAPDEQRRLPDGATWLLYRAQAMSAAVADGQRGVLQYVAPRDVARLEAAPAR